jgi:hypothetical protein
VQIFIIVSLCSDKKKDCHRLEFVGTEAKRNKAPIQVESGDK